MKHNSPASVGLAILAGITLLTPAFGAVNIDWAMVGNPGNPADTTGYGAVGYAYKIAQNETTTGQYCEFLNAAARSDPHGLWDFGMATNANVSGITRSGSSGSYRYAVVAGSANKPISYVSWFDAARFANWMQNGQGNGSTETGAYTLNGASSGVILKNAAALVWIPSENEWYKAAYYDPTKDGTGGYWQYPTQSNTLGDNIVGTAGGANYLITSPTVRYAVNQSTFNSTTNFLTDVGAYGASVSYFGTFDQAGNVDEWNDSVSSGGYRGKRGGYWAGTSYLSRSGRNANLPDFESNTIGFRLATVPEPGCAVLTLLASGWVALLGRRRR
ncbi:MAG: SUMF1/EgtB/PvdO family nonheme iron enzyme [Verrucomicrobia bacterium]|nr:SUMF1/EgtB/PvdO family nonheme iron enzyme [Verrucomicrobiota bacterium]